MYDNHCTIPLNHSFEAEFVLHTIFLSHFLQIQNNRQTRRHSKKCTHQTYLMLNQTNTSLSAALQSYTQVPHMVYLLANPSKTAENFPSPPPKKVYY